MNREKILKKSWITWTAIAITVWLILSIIVSLLNPVFARSAWPVLFWVFVLGYSYLVICLLANRVKTWSEGYLDILIAQRRQGDERDAQKIIAMTEQVRQMENKVDRIEAMLVKVSD